LESSLAPRNLLTAHACVGLIPASHFFSSKGQCFILPAVKGRSLKRQESDTYFGHCYCGFYPPWRGAPAPLGKLLPPTLSTAQSRLPAQLLDVWLCQALCHLRFARPPKPPLIPCMIPSADPPPARFQPPAAAEEPCVASARVVVEQVDKTVPSAFVHTTNSPTVAVWSGRKPHLFTKPTSARCPPPS